MAAAVTAVAAAAATAAAAAATAATATSRLDAFGSQQRTEDVHSGATGRTRMDI